MVAILRSPNRLLASLPPADFELFRPYLKTIELVQEKVLISAGDHQTKAYFPHSGVISLVVSLADGKTVEIAMVGRDSIFGASAALDGNISLTDAVVQLPGFASTLAVEHLRHAAEKSSVFRTTLFRHEQAVFAQAQQSAACNANHAVEARLARWLLRMHDLAEVVTLPLTQEYLAEMIGVKRNSVSAVAHILQGRGIIKYNRGKIEIIDLEALKHASCECYQTVKFQSERLLNEGDNQMDLSARLSA
jgi:CRP-like cAMP-binding protein